MEIFDKFKNKYLCHNSCRTEKRPWDVPTQLQMHIRVTVRMGDIGALATA